MIKNGYYYPVEAMERLKHWDYIEQEVKGDANVFICAGNRSAGKTVGVCIDMMIKNYEQHGERCMLLARTDAMIKEHYLEKWWRKTLRVDDDEGVVQKFQEEHKIEFKLDEMLVDGEPMCFCVPISMSQKVKDLGSYDRCTHIIMDEAVQRGEASLIIEKREAMDRIFEIWETVARGWRHAQACTNLIFIMNTSERNNWLFNDLGVNNFLRHDTKKTCQGGIYVEIVENKIVRKAVDESGMAYIMQHSISGQRYYENSQHNTFSDNTAFVHSRGLDFRTLKIQFIIRTHCLGIFATKDGWHIAKIEPSEKSPKICNTATVHREDTQMIINSEWQQNLVKAYRAGKVTFQTQESKALFEEYCFIR